MKYLSLLSVVLLVAGSYADEPIDENCDRILNSMADGCKSIRDQLISPASMEPKVVCCINFRYSMALQSVKAYAAVAKATRLCPEAVYDKKINDLSSSIAMSAVQKVCEKFETQSCITEPVNSAWNTVKNQVQSNVDLEQIGSQIGKNWNDAMSSLGNFAKNIGQQIQQQNIPGRLQEGATQLQNTIRERTKQLTDTVSGQGANRYSIVGDEQGDSLSLDSIVHSVIPEVEIVPKGPDAAAAAPAAANSGKRFNLMDWFGSLTQSVSLPGSSSSSDSQPKSQVEQRGNPYSVV